MTLKEVISVEDRFFKQGDERKLNKGIAAMIFPDVAGTAQSIEEHETLAEFSLSLLAVTGHPSFSAVGTFTSGSCTFAKLASNRIQEKQEPTFAPRINGRATSQWVKQCAQAKHNLKDRMHITASRYVRFLRSDSFPDGLLDLCISLESLLDAQSEISFRFGACLAKFTGDTGPKAEESAKLLSDLYDVRSKIAHGDPQAAKLVKQIEPKVPLLKTLSRRILTGYILFMSRHTRSEWTSALKSCLFS